MVVSCLDEVSRQHPSTDMQCIPRERAKLVVLEEIYVTKVMGPDAE